MKHKLPEFSRTTDRIFARGLGLYWKVKYHRLEEQELIAKYLAESRLLEKAKIYFMACYQSLKVIFTHRLKYLSAHRKI